MASPAEIANDMEAHAAYWARRDRDIERACRDAARTIRSFLAGDNVDGRTYGGLHRRLLNLGSGSPDRIVKGYPNFERARDALHQLRAEARHA
ncbi:hypothetical protein KUW09_24545 [Mameliella alba]|nr:hypothetical protein [Antarctobacter heliothermus]MBY6147243.1 hypothetical protein [Mameliella alba]MCA0957310.1 hypothetical protein [Mameliella alba]